MRKAAVALLCLFAAAAQAAPARVVSVNLCTDQLAMLLAA
ncbi:MAG: ABC transporter substrate-binding protein, partial [Rhodobacterales bacterium CG_4_9_14_3_um_filter_71_31]